jgi:hypothetical protein
VDFAHQLDGAAAIMVGANGERFFRPATGWVNFGPAR